MLHYEIMLNRTGSPVGDIAVRVVGELDVADEKVAAEIDTAIHAAVDGIDKVITDYTGMPGVRTDTVLDSIRTDGTPA